MPDYIPLGKAPESPEERALLLSQKVQAEEYIASLRLNHIQKVMVEFLIFRKGYDKSDLEINRGFTVQLPECTFTVSADIIINIQGRRLISIKCAESSLESWERHAVAFCRVADQCLIPYAVISDSEHAKMLNAADATVFAEGLDAIPSRREAERLLGETDFKICISQKAEKEKRILYAFEAVKCPNISE
ncbi:MAG: type I restriction enzyme HsdR N-terminal domain-containing protein [Nitrospirae bacterium]|nr:type I restriction enzyme HsdR N-terminal domain-containing protein [Nitrospirota bacterium]